MKILIFLLITSISIYAKTNYGNVKIDEVTSVYDGDTFRVNINSYPAIIGKKMAVRVNGIDTPEMRGKCDKEKKLARKAKKFTVNFLRTCRDEISLKNMQKGKYFRILADVYCGDKSLGNEIVKSGLAVKSKKQFKNWCR